MGVKVRLHPFLNEGKEGVFEVKGTTVGECLNELLKFNPGLKEKLFDKNGKLKGYIEILVNNKTTFPKELVFPVKDDDVLDVIVFLAGG